MAAGLLVIVGFIGPLLSSFPPESIYRLVGAEAGFLAAATAAITGGNYLDPGDHRLSPDNL